jgi:tetratricopeptide (TPR) repeat protein
MGATSLTVEEYTAYYDKTWAELMTYQNRYALQEYAERSVLTTWKMSYEQVRAVKPEAARLLDQWAFLHPGDMSYELVGDYARSFEGIEEARESELIATDKLSFQDSVGVLAQYSLVNKTEGASNFTIHAVVHDWSLYNIVDDEDRERLCVRAIRMVSKSIPSSNDSGDLQAARNTLPHARMAATRHVKMRKMANLELELHKVAYFMSGWESTREVEDMYLRALRGKEEAMGAKHTSTLETVNNLGVLYANQGKMKEAEEMFLRALRGREAALGAKHAWTLDAVNNLGNLYADQGKLKEADEMYLRALRGKEEAMGPKHTSTLQTVNNLGTLYAGQGKLKEAEEMYLRALRGKEEAWGARHTSTQQTVNNLGLLYADQGKMKQAEEMYMRALRGREEALGAKHTSTLDTVYNLGNLYRDWANVSKAKEMYERAAGGYRDVEGDHEFDVVFLQEQLSLLGGTDGEAYRGCQAVDRQPLIPAADMEIQASVVAVSDRPNALSVSGAAPVRHRKRDLLLRVLKR